MPPILPPFPMAGALVDVGSPAFVRWLNLLNQRADNLSLDGTIDARTIIVGAIAYTALPPIRSVTVGMPGAPTPPAW